MDTAVAQLTSRIEKLTNRLENVERQLAQGPPAAAQGASGAPRAAAPAASGPKEIGAAQQEFDDLVKTKVRANLDIAKQVSDVLHEQLLKFLEACDEESRLIGAASSSTKCAPDVLQNAAKGLFAKCAEVAAYKDKYGRDKAFNNIAGIAEAAACLDWIVYEPKPAPHLAEVIPGSEFYLNRVLTATKGKDEAQFKWAKEFIAFLRDLMAYVKRVHTTGLAFCAAGGDFAAACCSGAPCVGAAAPPCGPPMPPPPPPPDMMAAPASGAGAPKGDMSSVFSALNKGTDISKGLKHVSADMKTKNRSEEDKAKGGIAPKKTAAAAPKEAAPKKVKPPTKEHLGNKWMIENWTEGQIVLDDTRLNDMVYIGNCKNCTVTVKGKVNGITVDGCTKVGVVCDNIVSVVELVNSNSVQLQVTGKTPAINVDKCNGVQLFLAPAAIDPTSPTNIYTSKTSAVNVLIPGAAPDADMVELPVPEQFTTIVRDGKLLTKCSDAGGF